MTDQSDPPLHPIHRSLKGAILVGIGSILGKLVDLGLQSIQVTKLTALSQNYPVWNLVVVAVLTLLLLIPLYARISRWIENVITKLTSPGLRNKVWIFMLHVVAIGALALSVYLILHPRPTPAPENQRLIQLRTEFTALQAEARRVPAIPENREVNVASWEHYIRMVDYTLSSFAQDTALARLDTNLNGRLIEELETVRSYLDSLNYLHALPE
jgi:hypothetical protein